MVLEISLKAEQIFEKFLLHFHPHLMLVQQENNHQVYLTKMKIHTYIYIERERFNLKSFLFKK